MAHFPGSPGFTGTLRPAGYHPGPCFVPGTPDSAKGDGYIIAVVDNLVTNYSDLAILEAQHIEEGPIARLKLPFRLRSGLHGNRANASKLDKN